jgi:hypothetical protein
MALCDLLNGNILKSCDNNAGGVTNIYIADSPLVTGYTESAGSLTAITMSGSAKFYNYEFNRNSSSYTEEMTIDLANGTTFFAQTVTLVLSRREKTKRQALQKLIAGQKELFIIVKDSNGLYWAFGKDDGCIVTATAGGSGVAKGDANNYTITFTAEEAQSAPEVTSSIMAALISAT